MIVETPGLQLASVLTDYQHTDETSQTNARRMSMFSPVLYTFSFDCGIDGSYEKHFICTSKQLAWTQAGAYVACHVCNPPVQSIKLIKEKRINQIALRDNEISQVQALALIAE